MSLVGTSGGSKGSARFFDHRDPISPCIANALYRAAGVRMRTLPLTPERVWKALQEKKRQVL